MRFGPRKPSLKKKLAARASIKRAIRHRLGLKAPRGLGWLTNPRKAAYNRAYNRMTFGIGRRARRPAAGCVSTLLSLAVFLLLVALASCKPGSSSDPHIAYCRKLLDHLVKSPATVKVIAASSALEDTHIEYDANNSFGVPVRGRIDCWYKKAEEKNDERAVLTKVWLDFQEVPALSILGARTAMLSDPNIGSDPEFTPEEKAPGATKERTKVEGWTETETSSPMDGSKTVTLHLAATYSITGWPNNEFRPRLVVRCKERKTEVYVVTGMSASAELGLFQQHTVRLRFDDGKPRRQEWSEGTNGQSLFAPGAVALARILAKAKTFRLEFTPFNSNNQIAEFNVQGLDQHLAKVARVCGWKL
jgi:hypothetical protein